MSELQVLSAAEQVAAHLRDELQRGEWTETMPGGARLSRELGVGRMTVEAALPLKTEVEISWVGDRAATRRRD